MDFFSALVKILLIMAVLLSFILPGYLLRKGKLVADNVMTSFSNLLIYVCQPMLMVKAFAVAPVAPTAKTLANMGWVFLFTLVSMFLTYFLARFTFRKGKDVKKRDVYTFISVFSNCGFIGIPFIDIMTGGNSEAIMYSAVYNFGFNILVWTLGVYLMTQDKKDISLRHAFLNPSMIGGYVGVLFFLVPQINIFALPALATLQQIPVYFAAMTSILSMLIVGIRMADIPLKELFIHPGSYVAVLFRLVVCPVFTLAILLLFDRFIYEFPSDYVWLSVVIAAAMSPASSCVAYAEKFGGDKNTAATTFILGTLSSIVTVPLLVAALSALAAF